MRWITGLVLITPLGRNCLAIWAVSIHILLQYQYQIFKALVSEELDSVFSMRTEFPSMVYETSE